MNKVTSLAILAVTSLGILIFCVSQDWSWMSVIYAAVTLILTRELDKERRRERPARTAAQPEEKP